ncbi:MAG: hypothetical protein KAJ07_12150 [Planctomycetes bacterium]|nr:hypothetical protein [Planctomycetota bacterium]
MSDYIPPKNIKRRMKLDAAIKDINTQLADAGKKNIVAYRVANRVVIAPIPPSFISE